MNGNFVAFFNTFISYLLLYVIFGACIVGAVFAGIAVRKRKNAAAGADEDKQSE